MKMQLLSTAAALSLLASGAAMADTLDADADAHAAAPGFVQLDTDANGSLDKSEVQADSKLRANWDDLDENEDGAISRSEFSAFEADRMEERADQLEERAEDRADRMDERADQMEDRADERN